MGADRATAPGELGELALDTLHADQEELVEELRAGFADRREIVLWLHKASARTLGHIPDRWAARLLANRYRTAALLDDYQTRRRVLERAPDDREADLERQITADHRLLEASRDAMAFLARQADQFDETAFQGELGPQKYLAMRPTLDDLVTRQRTALKQVLGLADDYPRGLRTHEDVSRWVRAVVRATRGADGGISHRAMWSSWWRPLLLGDPHSAALHGELAAEVLTIMNRSIRETAIVSREALADDAPAPEAFNT